MRIELSKRYIHGVGLEIAAFHNPWPIFDPDAQVIYLDQMTNPELREKFPEMSHKEIVNIHVLDNANYLKVIPDESMDFVVSSHVFEHMENPGIALKNWLRVLRNESYLVMAIPLKHNAIDHTRTPTSLGHVIEEYLHPETYDLESHYRDYFETGVDQLKGQALEEAIQKNLKTRADVHFHCWDIVSLTTLFYHFQIPFNYKIMEITEAGHEVFVVLQKGK